MAHGMNGNGTVAIPRWLMWGFGLAITIFAGWAIRDRVRLGDDMDSVRERVVRLEAQLFTEAEAARMRETIRAYIDARIRQYHGGNQP